MADKLTMEQFAAEIRKRRPDLSNIPVMTLVGKTLAAAPELKEFVDLSPEANNAPFESPKYGPTGATGGQVAQDQAANVLTGIPKAITGIPSAVMGLPAAIGSLGGMAKDALTGNASGLLNATPFAQPAKGMAELAVPGSQGPEVAPESPEWQQNAQGAGTLLGGAALPNVLSAATSPLASAMKQMMPNAQRAGASLDKIRAAAKDVPTDTTAANVAISRAKELQATGHGPLSVGMRKYLTAENRVEGEFAGVPVTMRNPVTYPQSFDFASAAKKLAGRERAAQTGMMQGQVKKFASALQEANRGAAEQLGMGKIFDAAMKEYAQAKTIENSMKVASKYAKRAAIVAALGGAAASGYEAMSR